MNAKQQVLKVYPDAVCGWDYNVLGTHAFRYWIQSGANILSTKFADKEQAWINALNNIEHNQNQPK